MNGFTTLSVDRILQMVETWAETQPEIHAVALVGSWARGQAKADSDIDLMFLTPNSQLFFLNPNYFGSFPWHKLSLKVIDYYDRTYGVVKSRHFCFSQGQKIEFSFGYTNWADTNPIDAGTLAVASSGLKIIYDPDRLLTNLITTIRRG